MDDVKKILDEEAAKLFSKLRGIDSSYGKDWLSDSLEEEKKREDKRKTLLVEMVHLLSAYLLDVNQPRESKIENETFYHFAETFEQLINISSKKRTILIRYRGFANDPNVTEKHDYEVIYGNTIVDSITVSGMINRLGHRMAHLSDQFNRACRVFSSHDIYTLYIKIPRASAKQKDRFYNVLPAFRLGWRSQVLPEKTIVERRYRKIVSGTDRRSLGYFRTEFSLCEREFKKRFCIFVVQ